MEPGESLAWYIVGSDATELKLIACVAAYPVLYDPSLYLYRYNNKKTGAWRRVADVVGAPGCFFVLSNSVLSHYVTS